MELIYLWVENYKNIHHQGFNFSPKFNCHYDGETLTVNENFDEEGNKQYIENFFGDNINVTAIVGKNGSGKSSVLKLIRQIIDGKINDGSFLIFYDKKDSNYICIYTIEEIHSNIELKQNMTLGSETIFPLFDYSLTYDNSINFQNEQLPVYPKKLRGFLDFHKELIVNQKNIIHNFIHLKRKNLLDKFEDFFEPNEIKVIFDLEQLQPHRDEELMEERKVEYKEFIDRFQNNISIQEALDLIEQLVNLLSNTESYQSKEEPYEQVQPLATLERELRRLEDENYDYSNGYIAENIWEENEKKDLLISKNKLASILKIENKYVLFSFDIDDSFNDIINIILDSFPLTYFQIELIDNGKRLSELSFGEQQLLFILNQIYTLTIQPDQDLYDSIDAEELAEQGIDSASLDRYYKINYIILFDEIDIGFHPDWQKRVIQYIIDFLNSGDDMKHYHLIFTTHSPFLLSDIPKENILFLNDEPSIKQTFGANIHTLLSDSFFMEDGLMGEFAKNKIEELVSYLKGKDSKIKNSNEAQQLIDIIGESIIKNQLQIMLNNKKPIEAESIKKEIKNLEAKLKEIENANNKD